MRFLKMATNVEKVDENKSLSKHFEDGFMVYEDIEHTNEPSNSDKYQNCVKDAISIFENISRQVSSMGMFSPNEDVEEIATTDLRFLILPALLGSLTTKLISPDRLITLDISEAYYKDFLVRCHNYGITTFDVRSSVNDNQSSNNPQQGAAAHVLEMSKTRENRIKRYKETKEMENKLLEFKKVLDGGTMDEETKREYYLMLINWWILRGQDELSSINSERPLLEHMAKLKLNSDKPEKAKENLSRPKPLKPIIITRDDIQKQVYGLGYPSFPTMTVDEFYQQKVKEGTFAIPDMSLQTKAVAGYDRQAEKESDEIEREKEIEEDNADALTKARDWDDWKDEHRRGWGNRKNMG